MLYLASASPRRAEILKMLGYNFKVYPACVDESVFAGHAPAELVKRLSREKASAVLKKHPGDIVLGSDTVVALGNSVLGKPADENEAFAMLSQLSGKTHTVYTGVSVCGGGETAGFVDTAEVTFHSLTRREIQGYIATGEPLDKAGSYGIQGKGSVFIKEMRGDFFCVMGLPAAKTSRLLAHFGIPVFP